LVRLAITVWLCSVAILDWRTGLIPNWLTLPVAVIAGGLRAYQGTWSFLIAWVLVYLMWRVNVMGGGDAKLLMGLFALFPSYDFVIVFAVSVLAVSIPLIIIKHWGKTSSELVQGIANRLGRRNVLPTQEELKDQGRRYAWTFCLAGVVYAWLFW
jgi:Flp pilus assembly protein protease CpaA